MIRGDGSKRQAVLVLIKNETAKMILATMPNVQKMSP